MTDISAFGLAVSLPFELPVEPPAVTGPAPVGVRLVPELGPSWTGAAGPVIWEATMGDGQSVQVERGLGGEHRVEYGDQAVFVIDAAGEEVVAVPTHVDDPAWRRFLLDTVLWWTSLVRGFRHLHAGSVVIEDRLVAVLAHAGGGKSTLVWELLRRGGRLFGDDALALWHEPGSAPVAHPGPPVMNLPPDLLAGFSPGPVLASFGPPEREEWVAVDDAHGSPLPVAAAVLFSRVDGAGVAAERLEPDPIALVPHVWDLPYADRVRGRFDLLAGLLAETPLYSLSASPDTPVEEVADALLADLVRPA